MEGGRRKDLKSSLPLVGDFVVLLLITIVHLAGNWNKLRLNLASNSLQNPTSGETVKNMTEKIKHHIYKSKIIPPIHAYDKIQFHTTNTLTRLGEVVVCNIHSPPMTISMDKYNTTSLQRAIRYHAAVHNIKASMFMSTNEPCVFCLLTCHATVQIKEKNLNDLLKEGKAITPATPVLPNCQTYGAQLGREVLFKCFKPIADFLCTNKPVFCKLC